MSDTKRIGWVKWGRLVGLFTIVLQKRHRPVLAYATFDALDRTLTLGLGNCRLQITWWRLA